jgi:hypothetical protein
MLLILLFVAALHVAAFEVLRRRRIAHGAAQRIRAHTKMVYGGVHQYADASLADFPHLDAGFYERTSEELAAHGFTILGDLENVTLNQGGGVLMPIVIRAHCGDAGAVMCCVYHARVHGAPREPGEKSFHIVDVETPLDDGAFLMTSNAPMAGAITAPPQVHSEFQPAGTPAGALLHRHRERLHDYLAAHPGVSPLPTLTVADTLAHQARLDAIKAAFRQAQNGMLSEAELRRIAPDVDPRLVSRVAAELQTLDS